MSDFNPGEGWRLTSDYEEYRNAEDSIRLDETGAGPRFWVRESPVPPLPTAVNSAIRAYWGSELQTDLWLTDFGWVSRLGSVYREADMAQLVRYKVLSEPRGVTAKAVIEYIRDTVGDDYFGTVISDHFGVEVKS